MAKTKIKIKQKTKTIISIALIAFIISGLSLAAGIFYNKNYPKSKCKNAFKIIRSNECQSSYKKYTVVSFCSKNKSIQKLAIKKLKKSKKCYKSYKIIKKKACKSYYDKTIKLYCPNQTNNDNNTNQNTNQPTNEPNTNANTNTPGENASLNQNESANGNVSIDDPIDDEFEDIENQQPAEPIAELDNNLANINLVNKPGWPKEKSHESERLNTIIAANIDNQENKEILSQSLFEGKLTLRLNCLNSNNTNFNQKWPLDFSACNYCGPKNNGISIPHATVQVPTNPFSRKIQEPEIWAQPISVGFNNEIITSTLNNVILFQFRNNYFYSLNQNAENIPNWPKVFEGSNSNIVIANFENNQNTNVIFGNNNTSYILNNQGNQLLDSRKKGTTILVDNSSNINPKIITLDFTAGPPFLQIFDKNNNNIANLPNGLSLPNLKNIVSKDNSLTLSDLNNDGTKEIIVLGQHSQNGLYLNAIRNNGSSLSGFPKQITSNPASDSPIKISSADINQDQNKELVLVYRNNNENFATLKIINSDGSTFLTAHMPGLKFSEPLLANLNADNNLEIVLGIDNSLYIIDTAELAFQKIDVNGDDPSQFGYFPTAILTDLDNNNRIDIISNIGNKINAWELNFPTNNMPWPMPDQNNQRTRIAP